MACDDPHRYATRSRPKALGNRLYESLSALLGIIPLLPARLDMDRLASTISRGKSVGSQRNHGLVGVVPAEATAQHLGLPERTG